MNYLNLYNSILENASYVKRKKSKTSYYEDHHKLPACLGGLKTKDNMLLLTAKEHFICHHLLTKIHPSSHNLAFAFWAMCNQVTGDVKRPYKITATVYARAKQEFAKVNSARHKGKKMPDGFSEFMSIRMKNNNIHKSGQDSHLYGIPRSVATISKISETKINHPERNAAFKGYYITPVGKFASLRHASEANLLPKEQIARRCNNPLTAINQRHVSWNQDLSPDSIGKTFKDLGWDFLPTLL